MGNPVRYNGTDLQLTHPIIETWQHQGRLIPVCPEVSGGMSTPRAAAEIVSSKPYMVMDSNNNDVTEAFTLGANNTLKLALENNCVIAIMTESSPSCGSSTIYDGSFSGIKKGGAGITTTLLEKNGIRVFSQFQIEEATLFLNLFQSPLK